MYASLLNHRPGNVFGQFERLRRELDDVFGISASTGSIRSVTPGTLPAINIGRTSTSIEVYAFAPGLDASRVDVTLDRGVLRIAGECAAAAPADDPAVQVYSRERATGAFTRAISLPDDVDPGKVQASYRDGVLRISVARREAAQPRRIPVQ